MFFKKMILKKSNARQYIIHCFWTELIGISARFGFVYIRFPWLHTKIISQDILLISFVLRPSDYMIPNL